MDIAINNENDRFICRVSAIILNKENNKILIHRKINMNYYMLPGGKVKINESSIEAMRRELSEELNITNEKLILKSINEGFISNGETNWHEIGFYYLLTIDEEKYHLDTNEEFSGQEADYLLYKWVEISSLCNFSINPKNITDLITSKEIIHNIDK